MNEAIRRASWLLLFLCLLAQSRLQANPTPGLVLAWGGDSYGQSDVPANLTNVLAISAGYFHSLAVRSDTTVAAWGQWYSGSSTYTTATVPASLSNVVAVAGGLSHSVALRKNGTVVAWGYGYFNQTNVPPGLSNVTAIAAGSQHSLALKSDGTVVGWGSAASGQLKIPAGLTNVISIAAGQLHSMALRSDGTVAVWGGDVYGQTNVPSGLSNVVAIAAGELHSLALKRDGTVAAWGQVYTGSAYTNIIAPSNLSNVIAVAGGASFSMALRADGSVVVFGYDINGQLSPPPGLAGVSAVAAGISHCLAITPSPQISAQPPASLELPLGTSTNLTISFNVGTTSQLQWSFDGEPLPDATLNTLTITNFSLGQAGLYTLSISNQYGQAQSQFVLRLSHSPIILVDGADPGGGSVSRVDSAGLQMTTSFGSGAGIYYTLDGTAPDFTSTHYSGPFALTNSAVVRAIAYNSSFTAWAEAAPLDLQIPQSFPLHISVPGGGTVSQAPVPNPQTQRYPSNTVVSLTATPASGWTFLYWSGDATGTDSVATVTMNGPRSVQAVFGTSLSLATNGNGQMLFEPAADIYAYGEPLRITALPAQGAYFFGWAGDFNGFNSPLDLSVTTPAVITALFAQLKPGQVSLTRTLHGAGSITVSPSKNVYTNGETVVLTALPAPGYLFAGWTSDLSGHLNPLTQTLTTNTLATANFVQQSTGVTNGTLNFVLSAPDAPTYQLQYSTNLALGSWIDLGSIFTATNGKLDASADLGTNTLIFFRARAQ